MATQAQSWTPDPRERTFDMRSLRRLAIWGGSATAALLVAVVASYSDAGTRRPASTNAQKPGAPLPQIASRLPELDAQTQRLAGVVDALASDRERLIARIGTLERNLEDVTGAIKRQASNSSAGNSSVTVPSALPLPASSLPASSPPASSTPAAAPAPAAIKEAAKEIAKESAMPPAPQPQVTALARPPAAPAAPQPPPPARIANAPAVMAADSPIAEAAMTEFGVDVGGAVNFEGLRVLWSSIKGGNPALLEGLHPVVAVRENSRTKGAELRLLVGPLANVEIAARLCATLSAARRYCQPVGFEGQRLADVDMAPAHAVSERKPASAPKPKAPPEPAFTGPRLFR